jgi:hypothetical protein
VSQETGMGQHRSLQNFEASALQPSFVIEIPQREANFLPWRFSRSAISCATKLLLQAVELTRCVVMRSTLSDIIMPTSTSPATGSTTTQKSTNAITQKVSTIAFIFFTATIALFISFLVGRLRLFHP